MTRLDMMNDVMRTYGLEAKITIWFCGLAENEDNTITYVRVVYNKIMNGGI